MRVKRLTQRKDKLGFKEPCLRARAYDGSKAVGAITACETYTKAQSVLQVDKINVNESHQRQGIGTMLYREMADAACELGIPLASSPRTWRSRMSSGFWDKQLAKGRAKDIGDGVIVLDKSCGADLSGLSDYLAPKQCEILQVDTGGKNTARFNIVCNGAVGGSIKISKHVLKGRYVWNVEDIQVDSKLQRRGYATALYTAAAKFACKKRGRLASLSRNFGAHSHDFWLKQERKGRATRTPRPKEYIQDPIHRYREHSADMYDAFVLNECGPEIDLSGVSVPKNLGWYAAGAAGLVALVLLTRPKSEKV